MNLCLTSLVAAIPGAVLAFLLALAFMQHAGGWSWTIKGIAGATLLFAGAMAVLPAGIFIFGGPRTEKAPKGEVKVAEAPSGSESAAVVVADEPPSSADTGTFEVEIDERPSEEFVATADSGSDDFDFEFGEEEPEAKPKKKK
jgi:hypothetical protein